MFCKHSYIIDLLLVPTLNVLMKTESFLDTLKSNHEFASKTVTQGCGNTMPDLSDLVSFHSGQVENFYLLVLGQVQMY